MAASELSTEVVKGVIKKLEEEVTCSKCKKRYENPKFLQCFHVFCETCVVREGDEATVNCPDPECRRLPRDGVAGLQSAIHIRRLLDILDTLNPQPAKPQCKNCKNNDASCYCQKCGHICDACKAVHLGWESHEIITLDQQLTSFWCSKKCFAEGPGLHVAIVEQATTATVYVVDENGREYQRPVEVSCKMSYRQRESAGEVWKVENNEYVIKYTPTNENQHDVAILVEGEHISGSPFSVMPARYSNELVNIFKGNRTIRNLSAEFVDVNISDVTLAVMDKDCAEKVHYNYFLLHPSRLSELTPPYNVEKFAIFVEAVFYVGNGKKDESLHYLKDAKTKIAVEADTAISKLDSRIISIWKAGQGVVIPHFFEDKHGFESLTRQACMIRAIGHKNILTNVDEGCVHGKVKREWSEDKLRRLGVYLLHEAYVCYTYGMVQPHPVMEKDINL